MKQTKTYANTKPWVTAEIKQILIEDEKAFEIHDRCTGKIIQRDKQMKINYATAHK